MDNRNQLSAAIKALRNLKYLTFSSIDKSLLEDEERVLKYFNAPFDSVEDVEFEKIVSAATIKSVYSSSAPSSIKYDWAKRQARQNVEALRYQKLAWKYETDTISAKEYQRRLKENNVAQKAAFVKACKKRLILEGTKVGVGAIMGTIATALGVAAAPAAVVGVVAWGVLTAVDVLVPQKVKDKVKGHIREAVNQCTSMAQMAVEKLRDTAQKVAEKVAEKVAPVVERASNTLQKVETAIKNGWEAAKRNTKKLWNRFFH